MKKIIKYLFVLCFMCLFGLVNVNADSLKLSTTKSTTNLIGGNYNVTLRKDSNGKYLYCLDFGKSSPNVGMTFTKGAELDAGVAFILLNGYPNGLTSYGEEAGVFITQSALWWYQGAYNGGKELNLSNRVGTNNYGAEIKKLYDGAVKARNVGYSTSSMSVSLKSLTLSESGNYYQSSIVSVNTTGNVYNYSVSISGFAPDGTEVLSEDGSSANNVAVGKGVYVRVPVSSVTDKNVSFNLNFSAKGISYRAYSYAPSENKYQNMSSADLTQKITDLSDSVTVNVNGKAVVIKNSIYISKQDITSKEELPGAKLIVKDAKGNVIDSWISTNEPHLIENLASGTYTLTEETAPEGYELSSETITFEIVDGEVASTVVMYNTKVQEEEEEIIETKKTSSSSVIFYIIFGVLTVVGGALIYKNRNANK